MILSAHGIFISGFHFILNTSPFLNFSHPTVLHTSLPPDPMLYCRIVIISDGVPSVSNLVFLSSYKATCLTIPSHYSIPTIIWPHRKLQSMEPAKLYCFYVPPAHPLGYKRFTQSQISFWNVVYLIPRDWLYESQQNVKNS